MPRVPRKKHFILTIDLLGDWRLLIPIKPATDSTLKPATRNALKPATHFGFKPAVGKLSGSQSFSSECEPMRSRRRISRSLLPFPLSTGFA